MQNFPVTKLDRQRGWAELEIEFTDGKREFVRVHVIEPVDLPKPAASAPDNLHADFLQKSLRADADFVARISLHSQFGVMAMLLQLAGLNAGDFSLPESTPAMKDCAAAAQHAQALRLPLTPAAKAALNL